MQCSIKISVPGYDVQWWKVCVPPSLSCCLSWFFAGRERRRERKFHFSAATAKRRDSAENIPLFQKEREGLCTREAKNPDFQTEMCVLLHSAYCLLYRPSGPYNNAQVNVIWTDLKSQTRVANSPLLSPNTPRCSGKHFIHTFNWLSLRCILSFFVRFCHTLGLQKAYNHV